MEARAEKLDEATYTATEDESCKDAPYDEPKRVRWHQRATRQHVKAFPCTSDDPSDTYVATQGTLYEL